MLHQPPSLWHFLHFLSLIPLFYSKALSILLSIICLTSIHPPITNFKPIYPPIKKYLYFFCAIGLLSVTPNFHLFLNFRYCDL